MSEEKLKEITDKIVKEYQPEKIILFGSYAWGKPTKDSDVDLFIVKESTENKLERIRTVRKIIWNCGLAVDVLVYTPKETEKRIWLGDLFVEKILEKGKILYSQQ